MNRNKLISKMYDCKNGAWKQWMTCWTNVAITLAEKNGGRIFITPAGLQGKLHQHAMNLEVKLEEWYERIS